MKYILVENRQVVHLGPIFWSTRRFQGELDDLEVVAQVPIDEGYVQLTAEYEIFPIIESTAPAYDGMYQGLAGPFYSYSTDTVTESYTVVDLDIEQVKQTVKSLAAAKRYKQENAGLQITVQGQSVFLDTERANRDIFIQKLLLMGDNDTVEWKFPEMWLNLTKTDLQSVVMQGAAHVQAQFAWESGIATSTDAATTIAELQALVEAENLLDKPQRPNQQP